MKKRIILMLTLAFMVSLPFAEARNKCVGVKDMLESNKPIGLFANTAWDVFDAKDSFADWSESELIFTEEKVQSKKVHLVGYFTWLADGEFYGCEKIKGIFRKETRVLTMKTIGVSTKKLSASTYYKAKLSSDGNTLVGRWSGQNTTSGKWEASKID